MLVNLSPEVRRACLDLAAAVHFSEFFDAEMAQMLEDWAAGKAVSLDELVVGISLIADEAHSHVRATGDPHALSAWKAIGRQLLEKGFTVAKRPHQGKLT
jgi:hypothetical protein